MSAGDPFSALLAVQELDTAIAQQEHRKISLPERQELSLLIAAFGRLRSSVDRTNAVRQVLLDRQAELEQQTAAVNSRRKVLQERLYSARGAGRDMQAMNDEITQLDRRRSELEDIELEVLEEQEPLDVELAAKASEQKEMEHSAERLRAGLGASEAEIDAEIERLKRSREASAALLPADLAALYESLRARLGGIGAAQLIGNHCDGCHLDLSAVEMDRIRHLPKDTVVTCDNCGRILVRG